MYLSRFPRYRQNQSRTTTDREETVSDTAMRREWLSYAEAQELTHLGRTTLWAIISRGEVKAARVGRAVRINRASLEGYMEHRTHPNREIDG